MNGDIRTLKLEIDADRLSLVKKAQALREIYRAEMAQFLSFLDGLLSSAL
jgi:hypothetical protein